MTTESITLHHGPLSFSADACGQGPLVVCLHGFPDDKGSFRHQLPALAEAGYHAVSPALRGYEPSSQPADGDYHLVRMAEDVVAWIDELGADKAHFVGHDWGAGIGYVLAALAPERLHSLTTIAVPHPHGLRRSGVRRLPSQLLKSWYMLFFQLRGVADYVVEARDFAFIERLWRAWSPGWELPAEAMASVKRTFGAPGVKRAALAYYRALPDWRSESARRTLELLEVPTPVRTLAFTGALDGCMDTRLYDLTMAKDAFPAGLEIQRLEDAGHFLHQEKPEETNRVLLEWLAR